MRAPAVRNRGSEPRGTAYGPWRDSRRRMLCSTQLAHRLFQGGDARAQVAPAPGGSNVSCALGLIHPVLPAPACLDGLAARVHPVATRPDFRRRGLAREMLSAFLDRGGCGCGVQ